MDDCDPTRRLPAPPERSESVVTAGLARPAELTVVVPTFNESANVPLLVDALAAALDGVDWEVIFVDDDSPDGTAAIAKKIGATDARVRCLHRVGRRGLSGACLEGMLASQAPFVAVIDADLQHDEAILTDMLALLRGGDVDLVVGTRFAQELDPNSLSVRRQRWSHLANRMAQLALSIRLTDPMSGFFMLRRSLIERLAPKLSTQGFKLLMDIVSTSGPALQVKELPYTFQPRRHGDSKLDSRILLEFAGLLVAKASNDLVSARFVFFCLVGAIGIGVHFIVLAIELNVIGLSFDWAQTLATVAAITSNFFLNNALTYRDQRLSGWALWIGLMRFHVISAIGAFSNVGIGSWLFSHRQSWWVAGLSGALVGVVWNFVLATRFVWRIR